MDRQVIYPGAVPLETDLLNSERNTMVALAKLATGIWGTAGFVNGLTVAPNSPAALNVVVSPGEFYSLLNLDGTAYSSLAADTVRQILKQGILLDAVTLATPAPATAGQSVVYLIQASVSESDTTPVVLPYYNASNPSQAYSGPANAGTTNNTKRQCVITLQAKPGIAAVTGSQTTPAPDAGFTGLYAVTVANGQATVVAGNIAVLATAPYLGNAALLNAVNVFTQSPIVPTPAALDNTTKAATTAFVKRQGMAAASFITYAASAALGLEAAGSTVQVIGNGAPVTLQLPAVITIPFTGVRIEFLNSSLFSLTLQAAAGDAVYNIDRSVGPVKVSSGDWVVVEVRSTADWSVVAGGSGQNKFSSEFASSLAVNGYKRTPDKNSPTGYLIEQWQSLSAATGAGTSYALPIAFPNYYYSVVASHNGSSGGVINVEATPSGPGNTVVTHNGGGFAGVYLRAIGC